MWIKLSTASRGPENRKKAIKRPMPSLYHYLDMGNKRCYSAPFLIMEKKPRILALIPARYGSSRFPGKPLAMIRGESIISRIYHCCSQVPGMETYVVTDDDRIQSHVSGFGGKVLKVDRPVANGTERIYRAWIDHFRNEKVNLVFNVQGDIPLLKPQWLQKLGEFHDSAPGNKFHACTLVAPQPLPIDPSPHKVKAIYRRKNHRCLYFSRNPIPHNPDGEWFYHLGVYSFQPSVLEVYATNPPTTYEQCEGLEQLRLLEWGLDFGAIEIESEVATVDVPDDIAHVERMLDYGR